MKNALLVLALATLTAAQSAISTFDVATVKRNTSDDPRVSGGFQPESR